MANSMFIKANPARSLLDSVIYKAKRSFSRADLEADVKEYGAYLGVMECDANLIRDCIRENKRKDLVAALREVYDWFLKMDYIAAQKH